jgi:hypothetical protein
MKNSKLLTIALLFTLSLIAFSPVKVSAATTSTTSNSQSSGLLGSIGDFLGGLFGGGGSSSGSGSTGSTGGGTGNTGGTGGASLPINNNVWFLVIAGAAVGCKVLINKSKQTVQPAKI